MKTSVKPSGERGLTLVELLVILVILVIIAILAVMVYPGGAKDKARALRIQCVNNLKQTGLAARVWAGDNGDKYPMEISQTNGGSMEFITGPNLFRHFQIMSNELSTPKVLICPADWLLNSSPPPGARVPATNFTSFNNSNLSFFVNLDASQTNSSDIWSGDRNLTNGTPLRNGILQLTTNRPAAWTAELHNKVGNLLMSDGSVQQVSITALRTSIANTPTVTNHLQMPVIGP